MREVLARLSAGSAARVRLERLSRLQWLTEALSAAATPGDVAATIFGRALELVDARAVTLFLEHAPGELELVHGLGLSDDFVQRYRRVAPGTRLPGAVAFRTGKPVWLRSQRAIATRFPELAALANAEGDHAWASIPLGSDRVRGALELRYDRRRSFDREERDFIVAVARQCTQAVERARLYEEQQRLAARLAALQATTAALSAALTPGEVAAVVFRGLVGIGARTGAIYYLSAPEKLDLLFALGEDASERDRLARSSLDARAPHTDAVRTGEPRWLDTPAAIRAAYPHLEEERARRDDAAWVAVPLRIESRSIGALSLALPAGRPLLEDDRSFVLALAQQCAQALERARLFEAQRKVAERLGQIQSTAAALSGAATPRGVADNAFRGLTMLGASAAEIHALEGPEKLVRIARRGPDAPAPEPVAIEAPAPPAEVVRTGKALWLESPDEIVGRFPDLEASRELCQESAWAVVPLLAGGNTLGALTVAFPAPHRFEPDEKAFVRMLAMPCAQALERARLFEQASRLRADAEWNASTLDAMLAGAPVGLALLDTGMRFLRVNEPLARMSGRSPEALLGRTPADVFPGDAGAQLGSAFRRVVETGARTDVTITGEAPVAPGETRRWHSSWYPVRVGGEIVGVGVLVRGDDAGA
jgi:PAS domain S-box-containing protein